MKRVVATMIQQCRAGELKEAAALCGRKVGASRRRLFPKYIAAWSDANSGATPIVFVGTDGSADVPWIRRRSTPGNRSQLLRVRGGRMWLCLAGRNVSNAAG